MKYLIALLGTLSAFAAEPIVSKDLSLRDHVRNPSYLNNVEAITSTYRQFGLDTEKSYMVVNFNSNNRLLCRTSIGGEQWTDFVNTKDTTVVVPVTAVRASVINFCTLTLEAIFGVESPRLDLAELEDHVRAVVITPDGKTYLPAKGTRSMNMTKAIEAMAIIKFDLSSIELN